VKRPSGASAPATAELPDGTVVDLVAVAREVCSRFYARYPEEYERSGDAGVDWCGHDNQYLIAWAIQDARDGTVALPEQAVWLAGVLASRDFPIDRLVGNLLIAAEVTRNWDALGCVAEPSADALAAAAAAVSALPARHSPDES
jgi:hypothetical protein